MQKFLKQENRRCLDYHHFDVFTHWEGMRRKHLHQEPEHGHLLHEEDHLVVEDFRLTVCMLVLAIYPDLPPDLS